MAAPGIFDTNVLVHVVRSLKLPSQFLLNRYFPNVIEFPTEYISIDVDVGKRRMAPFVSPLVQGKPVESRKFQTNTFQPAYIKDKRTPDFRKPVMRAIGERIAGDMSPQQRIEQNLAYEMEDQVQMIQRRLEWMAAQSLLYGAYTVAGDGFEGVQLNFGRAPGLSVDISSGTGSNNPWSATSSPSPTQYIEVWARTVLQQCGRAPTDIIFSTGAFDLFVLDPRVQQSVWYLRSGDSKIELGGTPPIAGAVFKGNWGGYDLWVYNDWYIDTIANVSWSNAATTFTVPAVGTLAVGALLSQVTAPGSGTVPLIQPGTVVTAISGTTVTISLATLGAATGVTLEYEVPMMQDNYLIMASEALEGVRAFGSVLDEDFGYGALAYAPKSWVEKDPSRRHLLMQSAPVVIPSRVNSVLSAKVA